MRITIKKTSYTVKPLTLLSNEELTQLKNSPQVLARGKLQFKLRCFKCHGYDARGNSKGPSLYKNKLTNTKRYNKIYKTIYYGKAGHNMKGYAKKLLLSDIKALTMYVGSLNESN